MPHSAAYLARADEDVVFDFSGEGFWARLRLGVAIILGRPARYGGVDVYDSHKR